MKETNQQNEDTDTLHDAHIVTFLKPSLALCLSGRAELWLQTWQDDFQEAITDK